MLAWMSFLLTIVLIGQPITGPIAQLVDWLKKPADQRASLQEQPFAKLELSKEQAQQARLLLVKDHQEQVRQTRAKEWQAREIVSGDLTMKFDVRTFGTKPANGRSLFISMHGGGNTAKRTNDQQWENQKKLYQPAEGIYIAPRAPNDAWDMWFQSHMDAFFARLIENAVVFEDVDVNRVYIMGYSAGGDGVYRLAPRLADRWAAAAMMAGHPGDVRGDNLRNLPFTLHMGENDKAYDRNKQAVVWKQLLADLQKSDPQGYVHQVIIEPGMGHWMQRKDAAAVPWMAKYTRNTVPTRVVWYNTLQPQFYWLAAGKSDDKKVKARITAQITGQTIQLRSEHLSQVTIRLRDDLLNLDQPITIKWHDQEVFAGTLKRSIQTIAKTLDERHDAGLCYDAEVTVKLPISGR